MEQAFVFLLIDRELRGVIPDEIFDKINPLIARSRYLMAGIGDKIFDDFGTNRPTPPKHGKSEFGRHGAMGQSIFGRLLDNLSETFAEKPHVKKEHISQWVAELEKMGLDDFSKQIKPLARRDFYY